MKYQPEGDVAAMRNLGQFAIGNNCAVYRAQNQKTMQRTLHLSYGHRFCRQRGRLEQRCRGQHEGEQ